jgi:GNAT superfamily N-acetyltransferase
VREPAIHPVTADDRAAMDAWFALLVRSHGYDTPELPPPCPLGHAHQFSWPGFTRHAWVLRDGDRAVAVATTVLPQRDNLHHGFAHVLVDPRHRRRGLGSRMLRHATEHARAAGRTRLVIGTGTAPGSGFLRVSGARLGMVEQRRRLALPHAEPAVLRDLAAAAGKASAGYRLVQWSGPTPAPWRDDLAALIARMSTDAPIGGLGVTAQRWDADRVRERDTAAVTAGVRAVATAAQGPDGHLVGYTEASTCVVGDGFAMQGDTLVAPAHRGHRLGLLLKLANLDLLVRENPDVHAIDTFNADDNRWMVAVNDAMGFRPIERIEDWELDLRPAQAGTTAAISAAASGP